MLYVVHVFNNENARQCPARSSETLKTWAKLLSWSSRGFSFFSLFCLSVCNCSVRLSVCVLYPFGDAALYMLYRQLTLPFQIPEIPANLEKSTAYQ